MVGNSRLGRVKIPSCLACDRPLIDKVRSCALYFRVYVLRKVGVR